jgi:hypothetical protein
MKHPKAGDRVYLCAPSPLLALRSPLGTLVREDHYGGYWVVTLDEPADCFHGGSLERVTLHEIREHPDNMRRVRKKDGPR